MALTRDVEFKMDDGRDPHSKVCTFCIHADGFPFGSCKAFPAEDSIPMEIWDGENPHTSPFPGDNGVKFKKA